jgi:ribosomal protein S18 acetylase RimI-like enzyme
MAGTLASETVLRPLAAADLPGAAALTSSFGWPHRVEDWQFMLETGAGLAAERDGALLGTAMSWTYGPDWAAMGAIGVAPAAQGQGLGRRLVEAVLAGLGDRNVVLHATEVAIPLYSSFGFAPSSVVRQYQGAAFGAGLLALAPGERLRPIGRSDPAVLASLDRDATGMDRFRLMHALLEAGAGVALDRDGAVTGFALLRRFGRGHVIGPVVAPDPERARALIGHFLASRPGQFMRVDVPEEGGLCPWLEQLGLSDAGPAFRMVRGNEPPPGSARLFAVASQAFG